MSINLFELAKAATSGPFANALGPFLGESAQSSSSGLAAALPALIGAFANKGASHDGASSLLSLINGSNVDAGIVDKLGGLFGNGGAGATSLMGVGASLLGSILGGDKVGGFANALGAMSGLKGGSATSLIGLLAPVVLGMIKSHVTKNNLGAAGLMDMLKGQSAHAGTSIDPRLATALGLPGVVKPAVAAATAVHSTAAVATAAAAPSAMRFLPWLIGAAALAWLFSSMFGAKPAPAPAPAPAPVVTAPAAPAPAPAPAPAAAPAVVAAKVPDAVKLYFDVGKYNAPADAAKMVDGLVEYSRSSANTKLSISGFHDKTGDAAANIELSKNRAMTVKDMLISAGVPADRIMMQKPAETTGGGDDKEARRVEVSVAQ